MKNLMGNLLINQNWDNFDTISNPDIQWEIILGYVKEILSVMCPYKTVNTRKKVTPWLTPEIYRAIRDKKILIKSYKSTKDPEILKQAKIKRNFVNSLIEKSKSEYIKKTLKANSKKTKKFWKLIKGLVDSADSVDITSYIFNYTNQDVAVPPDKVPDFLNNYFVNIAEKTRLVDDSDYETCYNDVNSNLDFIPPTLEDIYCYMMEIDVNTSSCIEGINTKICKILLDKIPSKFVHLFATSLYYSKFPMAWTCSYVTLIPKDGDKTLPGNWRPISQTIVFAKILEKIVHKQVLEYFLANNIITEYQYGFLPGKSTQEAVFNIVRYMYSTINQNKLMGMVFLDIAKAFNCIDHNTLYRKLRDVGMSDRIVDWFRSYLHRHQIVKYGDSVSTKMYIPAGIAQGTVLGPLIFIFYINDCIRILHDAHISMFADDCVLYSTGNNWNNIHSKLQADLDHFINWTKKNSLSLHAKKSQAMIVGTRNKISKLNDIIPFQINNICMKYVKQYNYLGIILDAEMSLIPLCKNVEKRVIDKVFMIRKIRRYITYHAALQIYKQLILPIFDYAGFLLIACNKNKKHDLQVMQNDVLRFCNNNRREDRVMLNDMHKHANLVSLEQRRCKHVLSLMYKLSKNADNRKIALRNTRQQEKYVFRTDVKIGTKYSNSPYYKGTKLWNTLTREIQFSDSMFKFKNHLKPYFNVYDQNFYV